MPGANRVTVVLSTILILALIAIPIVFVRGYSQDDDGASPQLTDGASLQRPDENPFAREVPDLIRNSTGSQVSFYRLSDGYRTGTATERFARPALSLIKLYIADHVLEHGTLAEKYEAIAMISSSDDRSAERLYRKYPESIEETAEEYGLASTLADVQWGYSVTSTYDAVSFIAQLMEKDPTSPILVAMAEADPVAADGYGQDFGTSVLPGVLGTKWGWSDDRQLHSSVSFGENFVVAAAVTGSAKDLTGLVERQLTDEVRASTR